ncbi:succinate dehydrogenase assembly factor 4, mitochondrial [[Candida] anglica]|uniref:Succinate dehydrogenase assembly factor 4, mitochondrial n=1 Tax=[Candida] anglica TaxID=148631 RepID=A0ABP0EA90_9ASCO
MQLSVFRLRGPLALKTSVATSQSAVTRVLVPARNYSFKLGAETAGPPRLPKEEQEEFEKLQKIASSQAAIEEYNRGIEKESVATSPEFFKIIPEFEGDVNPKTGERGGPKQDPLRHGSDWSFNGRVTDF